MPYVLDGAGLFCGVLKHLLNRGATCPKVLVATHFHEVFSKNFLNPDGLPITFLRMQVLFTSSSGELVSVEEFATSDTHADNGETSCPPLLGEKITYLYRCKYTGRLFGAFTDVNGSVAPGLAYTSNAAHCAAMFGLPGRTVARAQYVRYNQTFDVVARYHAHAMKQTPGYARRQQAARGTDGRVGAARPPGRGRSFPEVSSVGPDQRGCNTSD